MKTETTLYQDCNKLCNKLDLEIMYLTNECADSPCIIPSDNKNIDIFTKMYNINEAFKLVAKARTLLQGIQE